MARQRDEDYEEIERTRKFYRVESIYNIYNYILTEDKKMFDWIISVCKTLKNYLQEAMIHVFAYNKYAYTPKFLIFGDYIKLLIARYFGYNFNFDNTSINICLFLVDEENKAEIKTKDNEAIIPTRIWGKILEYTFKKICENKCDVENYKQDYDVPGKFTVFISKIKFNLYTKKNFNKNSSLEIYTNTEGFIETNNNCQINNILEKIKNNGFF